MKVQIKHTYPHSIEAVWTALTDARAIRQWWVDTDFEPTKGHEFFFQDVPQGGWDGRVTGRVLEVDVPHLVRFSWTGDGHETEVSYRLTTLPDGGTCLELTHTGFRGVRGLFLRTLLRFGWGKLVRRILPDMARHVDARGIEVPFEEPPKSARVKAA